ncbi:hypothetical protein EK904_007345 [Melospiza melodia maxima]|nr:hypothetical protein EK904_007345 [Melospiza melodia maxima]
MLCWQHRQECRALSTAPAEAELRWLRAVLAGMLSTPPKARPGSVSQAAPCGCWPEEQPLPHPQGREPRDSPAEFTSFRLLGLSTLLHKHTHRPHLYNWTNLFLKAESVQEDCQVCSARRGTRGARCGSSTGQFTKHPHSCLQPGTGLCSQATTELSDGSSF